MDNDSIETALHHLGITIPHGIQPGYGKGGLKIELTNETQWNNYGWNPPQGMGKDFPADPAASTKPAWSEITAAHAEATVASHRRLSKGVLRSLCRETICEAYEADSVEDEMMKRLGNRQTAAQDTERERLRTRYQAIKTYMDGLSDTAIMDFHPNREHFTMAEFPPSEGE